MVQDQMVGQTKDDKAGGSKPSIATAVASGVDERRRARAMKVRGRSSGACKIIGGAAQKVAFPSMFPAPLSVPERGRG